MPKSKSKIKKSIITSAAAIIGLTEQLESSLCCSKRNCPSHWHDRLTEKLKILQQSKLKSSPPPPPSVSLPSKSIKRCRKLPHSNILSKLFSMNITESSSLGEIYSTPIAKSIVLEKHEIFANKISKIFDTNDDDLPYCFTKTNLKFQMEHRMISLVADPFSDQMDRMEMSTQLKINLLHINHIHLNSRLPLKIISTPIYNHCAVHIIVQDENTHCIRLSIYNWSHIINSRQIKSYNYIQECLIRLLPINSCIVLLDPWLKICQDGEISLRCESPNTHLLMIDFETRCSTNNRTNIDQLRQWGNVCYQADDNLSAIEFYTYGLRQIDEQQEINEYQQHRIRLLSNRCACYLRERHSALALADTNIILSINELSHVLQSSKTTAGKLLFRCLSAHLHLNLFDKVENLIKLHKYDTGLINEENFTSITILERELIRLKDEHIKGRYDLQGMLREQISFHTNEKSSLMFIDLPHYHAEYNRNDLFEIRTCRPEELLKNGYSKGSYGVYALKNIEPGTLLIVEQPFASIDNRIINEQHNYSINYWQINDKNSNIKYFNDDSLRLLNEIEKQLLIGNTSWITFNKLKLIQPIRQWLIERKISNNIQPEEEELFDNEQIKFLFKKPWENPFSKQISSTTTSFIPWRILFETQQQNPFNSKSTLGLYPLSSMFNHSCLPNCLWYLIGDCLFLYICGSNIRQGDELTISYCPLWISSLNERTLKLREFGINNCQCLLCLYDRSNMPQYENELKSFSNLRALARQKNLSIEKRFNYVKKLKHIYELITKKFQQRPIGFITEFIDLEYISNYFNNNNNNNEIQEFLDEQKLSFLQRLSYVCRFTIKDLPKIGNPIVLFGIQMQLLVYHLEHYYTHINSCDLKQWNRLLECLYEIFTFKCHSSISNMQKTLNDHQQLFNNLLQTQTFFQHPTIL